jgi:membrane protease YdiL (CAAX protease family)
MENKLDTKRIWIFLAFAVGIAWLVALVIYFTGGLVNSPALGGGFTLATLLLATGYMWAPALANIFTRLITKEGWKDLFLRPQLKRGWGYWLIAWLGTPVIMLAGGIFYYLVFPQYFDASLSYITEILRMASVSAGNSPLTSMNPWFYFLIQAGTGILISPFVNLIFVFGEEFGWRAYLVRKLLPFGGRKAMILTGLIWGLWHAPVIAMGHNYGFEYPGFPWLGILAMTWFCITSGIFAGWLALKAQSVWPAVIFHAILNGIAGLALTTTTGQPNPLFGPASVGVVSGVGFLLAAIAILIGWKDVSRETITAVVVEEQGTEQ